MRLKPHSSPISSSGLYDLHHHQPACCTLQLLRTFLILSKRRCWTMLICTSSTKWNIGALVSSFSYVHCISVTLALVSSTEILIDSVTTAAEVFLFLFAIIAITSPRVRNVSIGTFILSCCLVESSLSPPFRLYPWPLHCMLQSMLASTFLLPYRVILFCMHCLKRRYTSRLGIFNNV